MNPLLESFATRLGLSFTDVPHRSTVEIMAQKLGVVAELQTAEVILVNNNCTLGFDATTQEGVHLNSIHVTTKSNCYAVAVDELAGGTADDYYQNIVQSIDNLAKVYCHFNEGTEFPVVSQDLIEKIDNSLTDRCAANHATIQLLNQTWDKTLRELNCHLYPLNSLSTKARSALKKVKGRLKLQVPEKKLFGSDCGRQYNPCPKQASLQGWQG